MPSLSPEQLLNTSVGHGLTVEEAGRILALAEDRTVEPGTSVFREGDPGDGLHVIVSGQLEILKRDRGGSERMLAQLGPGSVIGEMSLVAGDARRSATARAVNPVKLVFVPSSRFWELLRKDDVASLKMVRNIAEVMSRRLLLMDEKVVDALSKAESVRREDLGDFSRLLEQWSF